MLTTSRFHQKTLPVWISVVSVLTLWICCKWYYQDWFDDGFKYVAKSASLSATTLMCWCVVLSARFRPLENYFGGLDKVYQVHKRLGKLLCLLILLHPLFLAAHKLPDFAAFLSYFGLEMSLDGVPLGKDLGLAALVLLYALVGLSLRLLFKYDTWKRTHEWLGPVFLLSSLHVYLVDADVARYAPLRIVFWAMLASAICSWIYIRFLYPCFGPRLPYQVEFIEPVGDVLEITFRPLGRHLDFKASQFVYLVVRKPSITPEPHPYSIASGYNQEGTFKLGIKAAGDHSRSLALLEKGDKVDVFGPYGRFSDAFFTRGTDCVFIGGGIGITPFIGMWHVALHTEERVEPGGMSSLVRVKHPELSSDWRAPKAAFFYICRTREEACFDDDIKAQVTSSPLKTMECAREAGYPYELHVSQEQGRFNVSRIEEILGVEWTSRLFFLCGSTIMMESLSAQLLARGVRGENIIIEDFNLV